jgi:leader peptidase (prepilin peptidase) / N-methyltransferase
MQLVDYLNGMWYMICLPSLLCGLAVSVEDIHERRIPRAWIAMGCTAQITVNIIYALSVNSLFLALQSLLFAALATVLQCALALIKPGALGFGDVTVTLVMGLGVGMAGLYAMVLWWLLIAVIGLLWIALWTRFDPQRHTRYAGRTPFAPAIVSAGAISVMVCALL